MNLGKKGMELVTVLVRDLTKLGFGMAASHLTNVTLEEPEYLKADKSSKESFEAENKTYIDKLEMAEEYLEAAKSDTRCGTCLREIDEILKILHDKKEKLVTDDEIMNIMVERRLKSFFTLDEKRKEEIRKEAERRVEKNEWRKKGRKKINRSR